jgi:Ca-activated chloride channel family protein
MIFGNPRMLWLLLITMPLLAWFFWWAWRKKQFLIGQFVQSRLLANLTVGVSKTVQKGRMALLWGAVGLLIFTLARPLWGFAWEEAKQMGLDIVVAIDTSRSMLAEDVAPNRLARAKLAALDLMRLAQSDRLGLVAFAGTAFLQCPLTLDEEAFRQSVDALEVGIIPQGGSAITEAIETAAKAFKEEGDNHKVLILLTDGEDHEAGALEAAKKAADAGLRIFTVGVGTPDGELLRQRDQNGAISYVKDEEGNVVKSRLNETLLTQVATAAQGFYLPMSGGKTVEVLYERGLAPLPKSEGSSKSIKRLKEQFQWPLGLAIGLLILELFLPDRKRVPKTEAIVAASANAALRKAVAPVALLCLTVTVAASPGSALRKLEAGKYDQAQAEYRKLLERKPDDARLHYNAGAAAYHAENFEDAAKHFGASLTSPDLDLQQRSYYNLGNAFYRMGERQSEPPKKIEAWEQSAKQFEGSLKLNPQDTDAKFNLELVKKKLEELKQQQQQQQQKPDSQEPDKDDKDKEGQKGQDKDQSKSDQQQKQEQDDKSKDSQPKQDSNQSDKDSQEQKPPKDQDQKKQDQSQTQDNQDKDQGKQSKPQPKPDSRPGEKSEQDPATAGSESAPLGRMTAEQVKRLLDAQKGDEKAMIFVPKEKGKGRIIFKDW